MRPLQSDYPSDLTAFAADHFPERGIRPDEPILRSWYRSVAQHRLDPHGPVRRNILTAAELNAHRQRRQDYLDLASQGVTGLARRVVPAGFAVLLSDEQGVTLDARLPAQAPLYTEAGLMAGACWDEAVVGTSGIGTVLATAQPMTIHHQEHFLVSNFRLSCSVAPIFDASNQLRGCLNATSLHAQGPKDAQFLTMQLVLLYARLIENASFRQQFRDRLTLSIKYCDNVADLAAEQLLALDDQGYVIGANQAAFLAGPQQLLGHRIDQLLPVQVEELIRLSHGGAHGVRLRNAQDQLVDLSLRMPAAPTPRTPIAPLPAQVPTPVAARPEHPALERLCGQDPRLQEGVRRLRRMLDRGIPILLTGETGTGKEAFARAIHQASARRDGPFVALNCAAIPESLIESELFGYRGGSFTGASRKGMKGKLELASGGTLFLDEIGDMPAHLQTRLLRVLAEREIFPLGAEAPVPLDVQVISATHQDLGTMIRDRHFREDLFYRLSGMTLPLPALRQRTDRDRLIDDLLAAQEAGEPLQLAPEVREYLHAYEWPGNIRQLLNCLRYAAAMAEGGRITLDCLPPELGPPPASPQPDQPVSAAGLAARLDSDEARHLLAALQAHRWNISAVAAHFGLARSTLYRKMKKHGIVSPNAAG